MTASNGPHGPPDMSEASGSRVGGCVTALLATLVIVGAVVLVGILLLGLQVGVTQEVVVVPR
jgi:hypothetical protein